MSAFHLNQLTCSLEGCELPHNARGYCWAHWDRWRKWGDPRADLPLRRWTMTVEERFWAKVAKSEGCWIWNGAVSGDGYGSFYQERKWVKAHRLSWELSLGMIPQFSDPQVALCVLHHCDTPRCVRPDHLFLGTNRDNVADMVAKGRHRHRHSPTAMPEMAEGVGS